MLVQLGSFQFDSTEVSYETLERVSGWNWEEIPIIGDYPALQFAGRMAPTITFSGNRWEYVGNSDLVQGLEDLANETEPLALTADTGRFYGFWVIKSLRRNEEFFRAQQESPIKTAWTLSIAFYGKGEGGETAQNRGAITQPSTVQTPAAQSGSVKAAASQLKAVSNQVVESKDVEEIQPIKTIPEYNELTSNAEADAAALSEVETNIAQFEEDVQETDAPVSEIPSTGGFFNSIDKYEGILDNGQAQRRRIGTVQRKARNIEALNNNSAFNRFSSTLKAYDSSIVEVMQTRRTVDSILNFKDFITTVKGVSFTSI